MQPPFEPPDNFVAFSKADIKTSIPARFERQVCANADRLAVKYHDESFTYLELNQVANQIAHALHAHGMREQTRVALLVQQGPRLVAAILGVLKAGGIYVPLDASYPVTQLESMIRNADADLFVTDRHNRPLAQELASVGRGVVDIDQDTGGLPSSNLDLSLESDALAYIYFTSGSTGEPKGVVDSHRNVLHNILRYTNGLYIAPTDRLSLIQSCCFSGCVSSLFGALLNGAAIFPFDLKKEGTLQLSAWVEREGITIFHSVPSLFRELVAGGGPFTTVRLIRLEGDQAGSRDVELYRKSFPASTSLVNGLGTTETGIVRRYFVNHHTHVADGPLPIGYPIEDMNVRLINDDGAEVKPGEVGEITVRSEYLAVGYWRRPELTARRFLSDGGTPTLRDYYTGDLGRMRPDGCLEYLGRKDFQSKIHGQWVELAAVEGALRSMGVFDDVVAMIREDVPNSPRLVAYLVASKISPPIDTIRKFLMDILPSHSIPSTYVILDSLPLNSHGKVDRQGLPVPDRTRPQLATPLIAPRTSLEEQLVAIWEETLNLEQVGIDDNFFDLGGHSLAAFQVLSRVRAKLLVEIPLGSFFENATVAGMSRVLAEQLAAHNNDADSVREQPHFSGWRRRDLIPGRRPGESIPLSYAQQRIWTLLQFDPGVGVFNEPIAYHLRGQLNRVALQKALDALVVRHEILRMVYFESNGATFQRVTDPRPVEVLYDDLRGYAHSELELQQSLAEEIRRPFDLFTDLPVRAALLQSGDNENVLLLVVHHIACDGWSLDILVREIGLLYEAFANDRPLNLPDIPVSYADYAVWQRTQAATEVWEAQLAYWKRQLADLPARLMIPTDRPRPPRLSLAGGSCRVLLPLRLVQQLHDLGVTEGSTEFMVLLAGFSALLYRYSLRDDLAIVVPVAGRHRLELEYPVGCFVNNVIFRTDLTGNPNWRELIRRVRTITFDALRNQDLPFDRLLEELYSGTHSASLPIFPVAFGVQNRRPPQVSLGDIRVEEFSLIRTTVKNDLALEIRHHGSGLIAELFFSADLFDTPTVEKWLKDWVKLLESMVADADSPIALSPLVTESEHDHTPKSHDQVEDFPVTNCLHELFEQQSRLRPDAVAVVDEKRRLTYRELDTASGRVGAYLQTLGVGPDDLVGICIDRNANYVVGVLGILKAGAAYVPLDPAYPSERKLFILEDAEVSLVLSDVHSCHHLQDCGRQVICLESLVGRNFPEQSHDDRRGAGPQSVAYVIYTSGSTGTPKGVLVTHHNVVRLFCAVEAAYQFGPGDVWTLFHSSGFDFSVWEMWGALLHGGRIVLVSQQLVRAPEKFNDLLRAEKVSVLCQTPSSFVRLTSVVEPRSVGDAGALRLVFLGGESLNPASLQEWFYQRGDSHPRVVNLYGITETSVVLTHKVMSRNDSHSTASVIGRPLLDVILYLLDANGRRVPAGEVGEIYVGGAAVARGYLRRPELTAERFLPDPFRSNPQARLYRSGDLARYRQDGELEFIGRADQQIKLRGFRIELGEIEATLDTHPAVRKSAVDVRRSASGDKYLVAHLVCREPTSMGSVREYLRSKLPEQMIPLEFVALDELPMTPHGKVDRASLSQLVISETPAALDEQPHLPDVQRQLLGIWRELLHVGTIDIRDDFFFLGGHSLSATQLLVRVREKWGVALNHTVFLNAATIEKLAEIIEHALTEQRFSTWTRLLPGDRTATVPLTFAQEEIWSAHQIHPDIPLYNETFSIYVTGPVNAIAFEQALNRLIERHEILRMAVEVRDSRPCLVVTDNCSVSFRVVDEPSDDAEACRLFEQVSGETRRPFDLSRPPLLRATMVRLKAGEVRVIITVHHLVIDAYSLFHVFVPELRTIYEAICRCEDDRLDPLPVQYADYVLWNRKLANSELASQQLSYWIRQLEKLPSLELLGDFTRPKVPSFRGGCCRFSLRPELTATLVALTQQRRVTLFTTLVAAFKALLFRWTNESDIVVGTYDAGRDCPELETLVGYFLIPLAIRTDLSDDPTFEQLMDRVSRVSREALAHKDVAFSRIVEATSPSHMPSRHALFQTAFVMEPLAPAEDSQWRVIQSDLHSGTSKFDLTLEMEQRGQTLVGRFEYSADLFEEQTIANLMENFVKLLEAICTNPLHRISQLPLTSESEKQRVLVAFNQTQRGDLRATCIHELFAAQVHQTPDAIALVSGNEALTYDQLHKKSNQLAHYLRQAGVQRGVPVAIYADRSPALIVGLLAVLKTGGAYVPLDTASPAERHQRILKDVGATLVLTDKEFPSREFLGRSTIHIGSSSADFASWPDTDLPLVNNAHDLAYIMYTSGSTGEPKGVMVPHRGVLRLVCSTDYVPWSSQLRFLFLSSPAFDASTFELWGPLLHGATCVIYPSGVVDLASLDSCLRANRVNCLWATSALFNTIVEQRPQMLSGVRHLLTGGESLSVRHVSKFLTAFPETRLINGYGPTEATTFTTTYTIPSNFHPRSRSVPIGNPIGNTRVYVFDENMQPVPIGFPGELYIGGEGVALGYWGASELTSERFLADPFGGSPNMKLYKTGDMVRWRWDGTLEFLGRRDRQVKIRGFRVEIGEVESALLSHPDIMQAAVEIEEGPAGRNNLIAHLLCVRPSQPISTAELRTFVAQRLPEYMIPVRFVCHRELPLTSGGKIDRRNLPRSETVHSAIDEHCGPPRTTTEMALAEIWGRLLGLQRVGVNDNFFELGGHSLLAIQLVAEIEKSLGRRLALAAFFQHPTVEATADLIDSQPACRTRPSLVEIQGKGSRPPVIFVHSLGEAIGPLHYSAQRCFVPDRPVFCLEPGEVQTADAPVTIEAMAAGYVGELRRAQLPQPFCVVGYSMAGLLAYEIARQWSIESGQLPVLAVIDTGPAPPPGAALASACTGLPLFLRNLPRWLWNEIADLEPRELYSRIVRKLRAMTERAKARLRGDWEQSNRLIVEEIFDTTGIPPEYRQRMQLNLDAACRYAPLPYAGRMLLFRADVRPLFHSLNSDLGWGPLAKGGIDIELIPCCHRRLLDKPFAELVIARLRTYLDRPLRGHES